MGAICTPVRRLGAAKPFVKWVGGKRSIMGPLLARFPERVGAYYEPFVGGGSVFFALANEDRLHVACLSDANQRLATTYDAVKNDAEGVIALLHRHAQLSSSAHYYQTREELNAGALDDVETAAAFIYLNRRCFNGLWRVNASGGFNASWGYYKKPYVPDEEGLRAASAALACADISCRPFDAAPIDPDGFYYFDPPYDGTYTDYTGDRFGPDEHERLAAYTERLDEAGAGWLLSNADTPFVRHLYRGRAVQIVESTRTVNCSGAGRGKTGELIIGPRHLSRETTARRLGSQERLFA